MTPSPVNWLIVPSKRWIPSARIAKKPSRMRCHSSASTLSAMSIDPCTSAKSTVTCLRSPSSALREVRIRSVKCAGVYERGSRARRSAGRASGRPQPSQCFCPAGFCVAQWAHSTAVPRDWPHSPQKPAPARLSKEQTEQRMACERRVRIPSVSRIGQPESRRSTKASLQRKPNAFIFFCSITREMPSARAVCDTFPLCRPRASAM
jgi:hypothetical protein